jgi:hypothetical protein
MKVPVWLLRLLPMWDYICPKCKKEVKKNSHKCLHCGEQYGQPVRVPPKVLKDSKALDYYVHKHVFPRISKSQREYIAQFFTEIFSDGFESGDFSAWTGDYSGTGDDPTITSTDVHSGSYAAEFDVPAWCHSYVWKDISSGYNTVFARWYQRFEEVPDSDGEYFRTFRLKDASAVTVCTMQLQNISGTMQLRLTKDYPSGNTDVSYTFSTNTWYCFEVKFTRDSSDGEYSVWINGSSVISDTGLDTSSAGQPSRFIFGRASYGSIATVTQVDDVVIADAYIGSESETYTKTWATDTLFKKLGITKALSVDTAFQKQGIPKAFGLDSTFQKSFAIQKQLDVLFKKLDNVESFGVDVDFLKRNVIKSFALDACFGTLVTHTISRQIDVLLKRLDATKTFGLDTYFGQAEAETYARTFGLDIIFAYKVRLPELWLDENGKLVLNISKPYTWVGT